MSTLPFASPTELFPFIMEIAEAVKLLRVYGQAKYNDSFVERVTTKGKLYRYVVKSKSRKLVTINRASEDKLEKFSEIYNKPTSITQKDSPTQSPNISQNIPEVIQEDKVYSFWDLNVAVSFLFAIETYKANYTTGNTANANINADIINNPGDNVTPEEYTENLFIELSEFHFPVVSKDSEGSESTKDTEEDILAALFKKNENASYEEISNKFKCSEGEAMEIDYIWGRSWYRPGMIKAILNGNTRMPDSKWDGVNKLFYEP